MRNYKMKLRGMNKVKNKKIILITGFLLIISILTGCGNTNTQVSTKTQKLEFTLANVKEVFKDQYDVGNLNVDEDGTNETFIAKTNVNKDDAPKLLKDIQAKIKENFILKAPNSVTLLNNDYKILDAETDQITDSDDNTGTKN